MKRATGFIFFLTVLLAGLIPTPFVFSETQEKKDSKDKDRAIVITSETLEIDDAQKVVSFIGNVDAAKEDFRIQSEKMTVYYTSSSSKKGIIDREGTKIDKIVALGDVRITREGGGLATAEQAVYFDDEEKVVLTGNPMVKQGGDFVEGNRVILFLKEKRSIVEGSKAKKVRAVISPRGEKR